MALQRIDITVAGERQLVRAFEALDREVDDMREPLADTADILKHSVEGQFLTEGSRGGTPWPALQPDYRAWKEAHFPGRPVLVRSSALRASLLAGNSGTLELGRKRLVWGVPASARNPDGTQVEVYASAHQTGAGVVPRRPIIALTLADRRSIERSFHSWLIAKRRGPLWAA